MSCKFPIGVETMKSSVMLLAIFFYLIYLISCSPVNKTSSIEELSKENPKIQKKNTTSQKNQITNNKLSNKKTTSKKINLKENITVLLPDSKNDVFTSQLNNILELGVYDKKLENVYFDIQSYNNDNELKNILLKNNEDGKIFIGPISSKDTSIAQSFCNKKIIFFSFSSNTNLAKDCVYLINFFPKNELEQLFKYLDNNSKVALLYPENNYGYLVNSLIDSVVNKSNTVLINRSSYKDDLSNVRNAIKELGKYELRKYELERQKKILSSKADEISKKRLKKLKKFRTTSDYDFTHILLADYGLNLLQVAPLLTYYDIDPKVVQFLSTGVIDDQNFFFEPSLQGTIFPGIEKNNRVDLINKYKNIYDDNLLRVSTLPYDLIGLLNFVFEKNLSYNQLINLLNNSNIKFDGVDGEFYFKDNMIERNLDILKIDNGQAVKFN